jgi:hypothetical protein
MKTQTLHDRKSAKERVTTALNVLNKLGFKLEFDENKVSQLVDVIAELQACSGDEKLEDKIFEMDELDYLVKGTATELASTLTMSDEEIAKQEKVRKKLRNVLLSLVKK